METVKTALGTVKTERFSMDFCTFGRGAGTLVILPGLSVQSVMPLADAIAERYAALADGFAIYVFDRRNGPLPAAYGVADMADDTAEAMRELGVVRADMFGASQGGMMAMRIAARHPELVRRLILGSTAVCAGEALLEHLDGWVRLAEAGRAEDLYRAFGRAIYPEAVFAAAEQALASAAKNVTQADLARFVILARGMRGCDFSRDLEKITCPVLVFGSRDDRVLGDRATEHIVQCLKNSPDCRLHLYDGWGHAAYDCAPDFPERMLQFLCPGAAGKGSSPA